MRILFENYNSYYSTEATYLHHSLAQVGLEVFIWEPQSQNIPVFDLFDQIKPDLFVTHYKSLKPEVIKRLTNDKCQVILNVSGATENEAEDLETQLAEANINIKFLFYNNQKPAGFKSKCVQIMPAADIFLGQNAPSKNKIPYVVVSLSPVERDFEVYHKISMSPDYEGDAQLDIVRLVQMLGIYDSMEINGDPDFVINQLFFEGTIRLPGKCSIKLTEDNEKQTGEFMLSLFPEFPEQPEAAKQYLVNTIMRKHTCLNRAERFAKQLGLEDACVKLRQMQSGLSVTPEPEKVLQN